VNSLSSGVIEAEQAETLVNEVSRQVQSRGWPWNRDYKYRLVPNIDGEIKVPNTTLNVDSAYTSRHMDVAPRGDRLYDRENHTYTFTVSELYVDLIQFFEFEELPYPLANYIQHRAARLFQESFEGSLTLDAFTVRQEQEALADLHDAAAEVDDANVLLDSPSVFQIAFRNNRLWSN
jgi:hypothetical protein